MTVTIKSNADGSGAIQMGGVDRLTLKLDGLLGGPTPALTNDGDALATTAYVRDHAAGVDKTWQDVKASRAYDTTYTNSSPTTLFVLVTGPGDAASVMYGWVNGVTVMAAMCTAAGYQASLMLVVPPGATYKVTWSVVPRAMLYWNELR